MRSGSPRLTSEGLLRVWDAGVGRHPVDRALTILAAAYPDVSWERLMQLTVGRRDAALLDVREATFGPMLPGVVVCPACRERLELALNTTVIRAGDYRPPDEPDEQPDAGFVAEGYAIRFRPPDSRDLAALAVCPDPATGRAELARRCLLAVEHDGVRCEQDDLPEAIIEELARQMQALDPQAEVLFDLTCPACDHRWQAIFDVVSFFWSEIAAGAKRLLREVHVLARAYGWRETEILAMSAARRRSYLELEVG